MALILQNVALCDNTYKMTVSMPTSSDLGVSGQFYMIKVSPEHSCDPLLSRPISIFDTDESNHTVTFLYMVVGRGTELMSRMKQGDELTLTGPLGHGYPHFDTDVTLIGGGVGAAPLYLFAKEHKALYPQRKILMHIGFRNENEVLLTDDFAALCNEVKLNVGGYVTDDVDFESSSLFYTCGTMPMMAAAAKHASAHKKTLYVSLDTHMACGVGACLVCTCKTQDGTKKRACKDGPVFEASQVYDAEKGCFYE